MIEYPKALYLRGWDDLDAMVTVQDAAGEATARADGYRMLSEPSAEAAPPDDREALHAALDAAGVDYDKRWGVAKLRALLGASE
jgi:hypothetical protein